MKTTPIIIGVTLVLCVGIAGTYIYTQNKNTLPTGDKDVKITKNQEKDKTNEDSDISGTIADLISSGKSVMCDFEYSDQENAVKGKMYMTQNAEKLKGNFTITQKDGTKIESNVLQDGEYGYFWSSMLNQGYKMKLDAGKNVFDVEEASKGMVSNEELEGDVSQATSPADDVNYKCKKWNVDNSIFELPKDVNFSDFSDMSNTIQTLQEKMPDLSDNKCNACDALSGDSKNQCLEVLGC